jgi:cellulose synthase/poly-beta-1,6-N-acetylglucosamine synthase-like glycosyltransferase
MITVIITSYNEPNSTLEAIKRIKEQELPVETKIILCDPFIEVRDLIKEKHPDVKFILDLDEGKSKALNKILKKVYSENKEDIIIFTDGDVFLEHGAIKAIYNSFKEESVGIVCGHPISMNKTDNKFGYWAYLLFDEMNKTRMKANKNKEFFELSGYLFAIRNGILKEFPLDASEDNVIPTIFYKAGYRIGYAEDAKVLVLNPQNFKDWMVQKKRNIKGHIALKNQVSTNEIKRKNGFLGEVKRGSKIVWKYMDSPKHTLWVSNLLAARLYAWSLAMYETKIKKEEYKDGWRVEETKSTSPLDQ